MKISLKIAISLALCFLLGSTGSLSTTRHFKVIRVYDGDTVLMENPETRVYTMLVGIDAPEITKTGNKKGQPFGKDAKAYLSDLLLNKTVKIIGYGTGPYPHNCLISELYLDGKNINLEMVKRGFAEAQQENLPKGFDRNPYLQAEKKAREKKQGIWSLGLDYVSPKKWRDKRKVETYQGATKDR